MRVGEVKRRKKNLWGGLDASLWKVLSWAVKKKRVFGPMDLTQAQEIDHEHQFSL